MAYSETIDAVGKLGVSKIWHLVVLILKTWKLVLIERPKCLYYLPASAHAVPVIRDIIYLVAVRWLFKKTIFHYHAGGLPLYLEGAGWLGKLAKMVYRKADVSIELYQSEYSPGKVFDAHKTVFIPNGLDIEFVPKSRQDLSVIRLLFLGALNEGKGVLDVIRTTALLRERGCEIACHFVGAWASESFKSEACRLVAEEKLDGVVTFCGPMQGKQKWQAFADADIFVFPSHYCSENFPLVIIEAMAFGLPIVSTTWRGIPQLVGDSEAAVLCDLHAPEQYADTLQEIYNNRELREKMGDAGKKYYVQHYTREKFLIKMEEVFRSVIDKVA